MSNKRTFGQRLSKIPGIGSARRFAIAATRLPETRFALLDVVRRLEVFETRREPQLSATIARLEERLRDLEFLASTVSQMNSRYSEFDSVSARSVDTERRVADLETSIRNTNERLEFVRREMLYEFRYGPENRKTSDESATRARIVNEGKVASLRSSGIRLNLGCGHVPKEGYANVDRRELPGVDVVAEVADLPFEDGEVHEIYSSHLLEHFPNEQLRRELLPYFVRKLAPGGSFRAVVPDATAMSREFAAGRYPYEDFREVTFGAQDYEGDFHWNMFSTDSLSELLREAGLESVEVLAQGRQNGRCFEFEIVATKPASSTSEAR